MPGERVSDLRPTAARLFAGPADAWFLLALAGAGIAAAAGWRPAAYLMLAALGLRLAGHLAAAFSGYRRTMERPWPHVGPLPDDDE